MVALIEYFFGSPQSRLALLLVLVVGLIATVPLARFLGWNRWGTLIAVWGLGGALIPTFVTRIGSLDAVIDVRAADDCISAISGDWLEPESLGNVLLLVPFGVGLVVASRSLVLALESIAALGLAIEIGQQVTGLGACERGDLIRNIGGGVAAVVIAWLVQWALPQLRPEPEGQRRRP